MNFHPLAEIFPLIEGNDFDALVASIKENGLHDPITVHDDKIIDGRNRYRACIVAEIDPIYQTMPDIDPIQFVIAKNLKRRHLNTSQRAMIASKLATIAPAQNKNRDAPIGAADQFEAAAVLNVGRRSVQRARVVQEKGAPELISAVERGDVSVEAAANVAESLPKDRQRQIVAGGKKAVAKKAKQLRVRKRKVSTPPAKTESEHDRDLRYLRDAWQAACTSAQAAFVRELGFKAASAA